MEKLLITGATGFIGSHLVEKYKDSFAVTGTGRNPARLRELESKYPNVKIKLAQLSSTHDAAIAVWQDVVIHAAAQKYVDVAEENVYSTIYDNITATNNLVGMTEGRSTVRKFIFISTDKASNPTNVYGMTKYLGERLVLEAAHKYEDKDYVVVRFGNVFGSSGSVVPLWLKAKKEGKPIKVTDPNMTRFMFRIQDAVGLVNYALHHGKTGDIIVPQMRSVLLKDLMEAFEYDNFKIIGPRPGEKTHEDLAGVNTSDGRMYTIYSHHDIKESYTSEEAEKVSVQELKEWIKEYVESSKLSD